LKIGCNKFEEVDECNLKNRVRINGCSDALTDGINTWSGDVLRDIGSIGIGDDIV
jgi:hypothetical protein